MGIVQPANGTMRPLAATCRSKREVLRGSSGIAAATLTHSGGHARRREPEDEHGPVVVLLTCCSRAQAVTSRKIAPPIRSTGSGSCRQDLHPDELHLRSVRLDDFEPRALGCHTVRCDLET